MGEEAEFQRSPTVRFQRRLPGPVDRIWSLISDPARLPAWFAPGSVIEPREGGAVSLNGGHIRGVVTQWKPERRLTHTWNVFSPGVAESPYPESYLTLELEPAGDGVALILTHLPVLERFEKQNAMGWHTFLDILSATARGEEPLERGVYMKRNAERYGIDLANLTR